MNILVTGEKSYVGLSFKKWLSQWPDQYRVDTICVKTDEWKNKDFSKYDALFHVAAVVHQKEQPEMEDFYYRVNRDLAVEVAMKAKQSGMKQFIFMSSMSVYGLEGKIGEKLVITKDTRCTPNSFYGKSKLAAELALVKLEDEDFRVSIIRAPMIYGPNCPGNYYRLKNLVIKVPIFPLMNNQRSMLFIDNLSEFVRLIVENKDNGLFFPQNKDFVNTCELVRLIGTKNSKKIHFSKVLGIGLKLFGRRAALFNKVFGNLMIESSLSSYKDFRYCVVDLEKSVEACEN